MRPTVSLHLLAGLSAGLFACVGAIPGGPGGGDSSNPGGGGKPPGSSTPGSNAPGGGSSTPGGGSSTPGGGSSTPGGGGNNPAAPSGSCAPGPARIWPLTPTQYMATVRTLLPGTPAGVGDALATTAGELNGFSNEAGRLALTEPHVGEMLNTVWAVATKAVATPATLAPCLGVGKPDAACLRSFVTGFGAKAFRRDLAADEADAMVAYLDKEIGAGDLASGLRRYLMYVFTSPHFVFRSELGEGSGQGMVNLTGFERAEALSYFISDGPPDAELFAAAKAGKLANKSEIEAQAKRLLAKADGASGYGKLFRELFATKEVKTADKDPEVFADWKDALAADLAQEGDAFIKQVLWGEGAKFSTLMTADFSMLNPALAGYYGVSGGGASFTKVSHKAGQRAGIMTQAGRMAALASNNDTAPVTRGRFVREVLLCSPIPPPPSNIAPVPPPPDGKTPQRERLAQHSSDPTCSGCHAVMDPLGLAFENYDGVGKYRTMDVGKTIDASGKLTGAAPEGASFNDAVELMKLLASSETAKRCFVTTAFRYAHGREATAADACTIDRLVARFDGSGGDMLDLAVGLATDDNFFVRQGR